MNRRPEIRSLTSLRGIAALLVVMFHSYYEFGMTLNIDKYTDFVKHGYLWVDFFFVLSGFVLMYVYQNEFLAGVSPVKYGWFILRRLARIYPLHVFVLGFFVLLELAKLSLNLDAYHPAFSVNTPFSLLTNLLLIHAWELHPPLTWNIPSWSISTEFAAYLVFPFLVLSLDRWPIARPLAAVAAVALLVFADMAIGINHLNIVSVTRCLPSFTVGLLIAHWYVTDGGRLKGFAAMDGAMLAAMIVLGLLLHFGVSDVIIVIGFYPIIACASVNRSRMNKILSWPPLYFLGCISYSMYMTHFLLERAWHYAFDKIFHKTLAVGPALGVFVAICAVTIVSSWITYVWVEQPGRDAVNRMAERLTTSPRLNVLRSAKGFRGRSLPERRNDSATAPDPAQPIVANPLAAKVGADPVRGDLAARISG
jgi:peptidoglycan/LPS O-acetylase OafA/YrhL